MSTTAEPPVPETGEVIVSHDTPPADTPEQQTFLRPRRAARRDWLRAGFFATLGAGLMAMLAFAGWKFLDATLAVSMPFVVGIILALLLDPLADKLERRGLSRMAAAGIVFGVLLLLIIGASFLIVPALINQASDWQPRGRSSS